MQGERKMKEKAIFLSFARAAAYLRTTKVVQGERKMKEKAIFLFVGRFIESIAGFDF